MLNNFIIKNQKFLKKIYIPNNVKIEYLFLKTQNFLFFSNKSANIKIYFLIPKGIFLFFSNQLLYLYSNLLSINSFFSSLKYAINQVKVSFFKTVLVRGTSYRITLLDNYTNILKLKLGYSHLINLIVPDSLTIRFFKRKIIIKTYNKILLGNFCNLLYSFRPINSFTGKGLLIKRRKKFKLKEYSKKI